MIITEELANIATDAKNIIKTCDKNTLLYSLAFGFLKLLSEFERVNRLGTEIREVNIIYADGTGKQLWPKKETI